MSVCYCRSAWLLLSVLLGSSWYFFHRFVAIHCIFVPWAERIPEGEQTKSGDVLATFNSFPKSVWENRRTEARMERDLRAGSWRTPPSASPAGAKCIAKAINCCIRETLVFSSTPSSERRVQNMFQVGPYIWCQSSKLMEGKGQELHERFLYGSLQKQGKDVIPRYLPSFFYLFMDVSLPLHTARTKTQIILTSQQFRCNARQSFVHLESPSRIVISPTQGLQTSRKYLDSSGDVRMS